MDQKYLFCVDTLQYCVCKLKTVCKLKLCVTLKMEGSTVATTKAFKVNCGLPQMSIMQYNVLKVVNC